MISQSLFSWKTNKKYFKISSAEFLPNMQSVNNGRNFRLLNILLVQLMFEQPIRCRD